MPNSKALFSSLLSLAASCGNNQIQTSQIQYQVSCDASIPGSLSNPDGIFNPFNQDSKQICNALSKTNGKFVSLIGSHGHLIGECQDSQYGTCYLSGPLKGEAIRPSSLVSLSQRAIFQNPGKECPSIINFTNRTVFKPKHTPTCPIALVNHGYLGECEEDNQKVCYVTGFTKQRPANPEDFLSDEQLMKNIGLKQIEDLGLGHRNTLINQNYFSKILENQIESIEKPLERTYLEIFNLQPMKPTSSIFKDESGKIHRDIHVLTYPNQQSASKASSRMDSFLCGSKTNKAGQIPKSTSINIASSFPSTAIANFFNTAQESEIELTEQELSILVYCLENNIVKLINGLIYPTSNISVALYTANESGAYWHLTNILSKSLYVVNKEYRDFALEIWNKLDENEKQRFESTLDHLQLNSRKDNFKKHLILRFFISQLLYSNTYYDSKWSPVILQNLEGKGVMTAKLRLLIDYFLNHEIRNSPIVQILPDIRRIFKTNR